MAAHKLPRFSKSILDKPQLLHQDKYAEIADVLENHNEYMNIRKEAAEMFIEQDDIEYRSRLDGKVPETVGVLDIDGPLTARANLFSAICGGTNYDQLVAQTEAYIEEGKKTLLLNISSPGGEAFKLFSTAKRIRELAKKADMDIIAWVDGQAASAAYGLCVIADTVIAHTESHCIGSVGVIISMTDDSKAMEKAGLRTIYVNAGKNKHPFTESGSFKPEFIEGLQKDVDKLYNKFVSHVANYRNLSEDFVRSTEASTYDA